MQHRPVALHAGRRHDAHRPAHHAAPRPLRHSDQARISTASTSSRRSCGAARGCSGFALTAEGAHEIARRARGTPRIAGRLLRRVRDFAAVAGAAAVDAKIADGALSRLEVDARGLDALDRRYLRLIAENFGGGPVGIETIAAALSEPRDAIEEIVEPFLLQQGFVAAHPARPRADARRPLPIWASTSRAAAPDDPVQWRRRMIERGAGRPRRAGSRARRMSCRCASISRTPTSPASSITRITSILERGRSDFIRLLGIDA